jgi:CubicO group peptidase (beta-lactamase class C family)
MVTDSGIQSRGHSSWRSAKRKYTNVIAANWRTLGMRRTLIMYCASLAAAALAPLALGAPAFGQNSSQSVFRKSEAEPVMTKDNYAEVGTLLDQLVASGKLPGASVLITRGGREVYYHQTGYQDLASGDPIERNTIFRIFSMTKPVTATALMILVDEGKVKLDDPLSKYVPELAHLGVYAGREGGAIRTVPAQPVRIKDLLTHTAGFSYWFQPNSPVASLYESEVGAGRFEAWRFDPKYDGLNGLARSLSRVPLVSQPGERWHYSMALEVAGLVIERASGETLDKFMKARIFEPLRMGDTAFSVSPENAKRLASLYGPDAQGKLELLEKGSESLLLKPVPGLSGGGGLTSTIDDYARFAEMIANGGELDGERVLSKIAVAQMTTNQLQPKQLAELPYLAQFGLGGTGDGLGFGLGGAVVVDPTKSAVPTVRGEYSWGGAASTTFWVDRQNHVSVVFMTQFLPPSSEMLWDRLHAAVYVASNLATGAN